MKYKDTSMTTVNAGAALGDRLAGYDTTVSPNSLVMRCRPPILNVTALFKGRTIRTGGTLGKRKATRPL